MVASDLDQLRTSLDAAALKYLARLRAAHHQAKVVFLDVGAAHRKTVAHCGLQADLMALLAGLQALLQGDAAFRRGRDCHGENSVLRWVAPFPATDMPCGGRIKLWLDKNCSWIKTMVGEKQRLGKQSLEKKTTWKKQNR